MSSLSHFYHVTTLKKLQRYKENKHIKPPLRCWKKLEYAEDFSKRTGRKIILRLLLDSNEVKQLDGHKGNAVFTDITIPLNRFEL